MAEIGMTIRDEQKNVLLPRTSAEQVSTTSAKRFTSDAEMNDKASKADVTAAVTTAVDNIVIDGGKF